MEPMTIEQHCDRVRQYMALLPPDNQAGMMQVIQLEVGLQKAMDGNKVYFDLNRLHEDTTQEDLDNAGITREDVVCIVHSNMFTTRRMLLVPVTFQKPIADITDKGEELVTYSIHGYDMWLQTAGPSGNWGPDNATLTHCDAAAALGQVSTECTVCSQLSMASSIQNSVMFANQAMHRSREELKREPMPEDLKVFHSGKHQPANPVFATPLPTPDEANAQSIKEAKGMYSVTFHAEQEALTREDRDTDRKSKATVVVPGAGHPNNESE